MVYRKRRYTRRRRTGRKRAWRRNFKTRNYRRTKSGTLHQFVRFVNRGTVNCTTGTSSTFGTLSFKLSDVPTVTDFSNLYDQYRIKAVKVSFIPVTNVTFRSNSSDLAVVGTAMSDRFFTVLDFNDTTNPTSINAMREYKNCKWTPYTRIHKRFFYPKPLEEMSGNIPANPIGNPWVPTAFNNVDYYGLKWGFEHPSTIATGSYFTIECKYYLQLRQPK